MVLVDLMGSVFSTNEQVQMKEVNLESCLKGGVAERVFLWTIGS